MRTPDDGAHLPRVAGSMPPARWRAVDEILQSALASPPERRNAIVAEACRGDEMLQREVASLLAAHERADGFLERPDEATFSPLADRFLDDAPPEPHHSPRKRTVTAHAALYACTAALAVGLTAGFFYGRGPSTVAEATSIPTLMATEGAGAGGEATLTVVDHFGHPLIGIIANRPWTPRFSPDGQRVAFGAFGAGRHTSDLWITDLAAGTTRRITDDDADANDPQWSADGTSLAFSAGAPGGKDVMLASIVPRTQRVLASRPGTQFPSDWLRDGSAMLVTEEAGDNGHDILVQPADGSAARPYVATAADETAARISPDGHWVAYTSNASGRPEVYLDAYPQPRHRVTVSIRGGVHPVWRGDGRELYYWRDGALMAVRMEAGSGDAPPTPGATRELFRAAYEVGVNTMYDVSPDGERFVLPRPRH